MEKATIYQLRKVITKAFEEAEQAGLTQGAGIVKKPELIEHITRTVIGELYELEVLRKIGPIFRMFKELVEDFKYLDDQQAAESKRLSTTVTELAPQEQTNWDKKIGGKSV